MKPKKMADGGVADDFDPEKDSAVNKMLTDTFAQRPGGDPTVAPATDDTPSAADTHLTPAENDFDEDKIVDSHPGVQPSELTKYLKSEESKVDQYGPEQERAVMESLLKSHGSPGASLAKGAAGFADAVMQGVAEAGQGNFLNSIEQNEAKNDKLVSELTPRLREANLKGMGIKEGLEEQSPETPLGSANLPALRAIGSAYGLTPDQVGALAKSNPKAAMAMLDKYGEFASQKMKNQIEQEMKMLEIQLQASIAKGNQDIARMGRQTEKEKTQQEAQKTLAGRGLWRRLVDTVTGNKAVKQLEGQAGGFDQDVLAYAEKHNISPEKAQAIKNKRLGGV